MKLLFSILSVWLLSLSMTSGQMILGGYASPCTPDLLDYTATGNDLIVRTGDGVSGLPTATQHPTGELPKLACTYDYESPTDADTGQALQTTSSIGISGASARSIAVWLYLENLPTGGSYRSPVCMGTAAANAMFEILLDGSGNLSIHKWGTLNAFTTLSTGVWTHIVITYDGSTYAKMYKNGSQVGSSWSIGTVNTTSGVLIIGKTAENIYDERFWDGYIDDVSIWNAELDSTTVSWLYNSGTGRKLQGNESNLVNWYPFGS